MTRAFVLVVLLLVPLTAIRAAETPKPLGKPNVVLFLVELVEGGHARADLRPLRALLPLLPLQP